MGNEMKGSLIHAMFIFFIYKSNFDFFDFLLFFRPVSPTILEGKGKLTSKFYFHFIFLPHGSGIYNYLFINVENLCGDKRHVSSDGALPGPGPPSPQFNLAFAFMY